MSWLLLGIGAFVAGVAKTSVGGLATLAVLLFAMVLPMKESTGAVLLIFIAGDLVATARYRRQADWAMLRGLVPWVVPGLLLGTWFITVVDAAGLRRTIGIVLAISVVLQPVISRVLRHPMGLPPEGALPAEGQTELTNTVSHAPISAFSTERGSGGQSGSGGESESGGQSGPGAGDETGACGTKSVAESDAGRPNVGTNGRRDAGHTTGRSLVATSAAGLAAGFTTMTANAGGPVMTLYLLAKGVDKHTFVGTAAWYFFIVNLAKVPFSIGAGAITWDAAVTAALLAPVVWSGCFLGIRLLKAIPQRLFNSLAVASSALAAMVLLLG